MLQSKGLQASPKSTVSLTSQRHPEKLPEVTGTSQGNPGFPATTLERHRESFSTGNGTPLQYSWLENPMDGGAWWAAVHGVAKSWARQSDFSFTFHVHALEKERRRPWAPRLRDPSLRWAPSTAPGAHADQSAV